MEGLEFDLASSIGHQGSHSCFDVLGIVSFKIGHFHLCDLSVESVEKGHGHRLLSFQEPIKEGKCEAPRGQSSLSIEVEIRWGGSKGQSEVSSPEKKSIFSGHTQVLIMRRHLFGSIQINICLQSVHHWIVRSVMEIIVRVHIALLGWSLDCFAFSLSGWCFLLEWFQMSRVFLLKFWKSLCGDGVGRWESE